MLSPASLAEKTAKLSGFKRAVLCVLLGALSVFAFAPFHIWPVLFVSLGGLVWLLDGCAASASSLKARLWCAGLTGFWFGFGYFLTGLYWVAEAFLVEPWRHGWLIPFVMTALPAGLALFFAAGTAIAMALWRDGPARIFALGLGLGLTEFIRGHVLTGFPWNLIGYGLLANEPLMQSASIFGVYALTVLAILLFAAPAAIWRPDGSVSKGSALMATLLLAALGSAYVFGEMRLANAVDTPSSNRVRLVQANVNQADKWRPENATRIFETYLKMTQEPGLEDVNIVVWPETAVPFPVDSSPDALAAIGAILPERTALVLGSVRWTEQRSESGILMRRDAYNSLVSIDSNGRIVSIYDKIHLVPFGEFLPFQNFLESLGIMQLTGVRGGFSEGTGPRLLNVPGAPAALPLICYEIIFPGEVRPDATGKEEQPKPRWMLNVTNDAWFGSSAGPYQHFHQARVRAVELGLPLVRAANTGISAVVDPFGRVRAQISLGTKGIVDADIPREGPKTVFFQLGVLIEILVYSLALIGWKLCRTKRKAPSLTA